MQINGSAKILPIMVSMQLENKPWAYTANISQTLRIHLYFSALSLYTLVLL